MVSLPDYKIIKNRTIGQLPSQDWLVYPETIRIYDILSQGGRDVRFVGGCVRDSLLKKQISDIDIGTPESPEQVMLKLERAKIKVIPTGIKYGTVTAILNNRHFQITTLRRDIKSDGRYAVVKYTDDWEEDAHRRDFTINALSANLDGQIYDFFKGIKDLAENRIKFIGRAEQRIEEDYLRILRYFRFFAHYGKPPYDPSALSACRFFANKISNLSQERITSEFFKILSASDPSPTLQMMESTGVLPIIIPNSKYYGQLRSLDFLERRGVVDPNIHIDPLRRLVCLLDLSQETVLAPLQKLKISRNMIERAKRIIKKQIDKDSSLNNVQIMLYEDGQSLTLDRILLGWAKYRSALGYKEPTDSVKWLSFINCVSQWKKPVMPLTAEDLLKRGYVEGFILGERLQKIKNYWQRHNFSFDKTMLLKYLSDLEQEEPPL
jgi:poly(A) polymerase